MPSKAALTPGESCVLALLVEARRHGWGIAVILARDGELGTIWSMARPLVYTSLRRLEAEGYIRTVGSSAASAAPTG